MRVQTKLQRAHRRLDVLARCPLDYHPQRLSQTTIAEVLGVSQQAISKSLRRTNPDDPEVGRIAALSGWTNLQPMTPTKVRARMLRRVYPRVGGGTVCLPLLTSYGKSILGFQI